MSTLISFVSIMILSIVFNFRTAALIIDIFYGVPMILPFFGLSIRRLHDVNLSGWFILLDFIPILGPLILLIIFVQPSKTEGERFGPYQDAIKANGY